MSENKKNLSDSEENSVFEFNESAFFKDDFDLSHEIDIKTYKNAKAKITELKNLSNQLISLCKYNFKKNIKKISEITLPSNSQEILLLQIILSSFIDNIYRKRVLFDSVGNEIKINVSKSNKKDLYILYTK